jgi:hypothetical protein
MLNPANWPLSPEWRYAPSGEPAWKRGRDLLGVRSESTWGVAVEDSAFPPNMFYRGDQKSYEDCCKRQPSLVGPPQILDTTTWSEAPDGPPNMIAHGAGPWHPVGTDCPCRLHRAWRWMRSIWQAFVHEGV